MKHNLLIALCAGFVLLSCTPRVKIVTPQGETGAVAFAAGELQELFTRALQTEKNDSSYAFVFELDTTLSDGAFAYREQQPRHFILRGGDAATLSHAAYSLLEEIGYTFDITGITSAERFDLAALRGIDRSVEPRIRWRGIRQHVNFPMDISSYPIEEAEEYLRNLSRMRFNKLAVHSYPGQWYEYKEGDSTAYAGHFFYGDRHYLYDSPLLQDKVRFNDSTFCMPGAEACYDDLPRRSELAIGWMRRLIACAKELGMQVQFSVEPRLMSPEQAVSLARQVADTYPQIDALEMITEETGGWGPACSGEEVRGTLAEYFSPEVLQDTVITNPIRPAQTDLNHLYREIGVITRTLSLLDADTAFQQRGIDLKMGIYCTMPAYGPGAYRLARTAAPGRRITIMPSHGSEGVAREFSRLVRSSEDMALTEVYSWIEFDGLMYIQQNPIGGIAALEGRMDSLGAGSGPASLLFNHWRTAENRTTARYAALSTLEGPLSPKPFYREYAARLGIANGALFARAMETLGRVDRYATDSLGNIGFCWMGAWSGAHSPYTYVDARNIAKAAGDYMQAGEMLGALLEDAETPAAREYLALLGNRTAASVTYLKAFGEVDALGALKRVPDGPVELSGAEQARVVEVCNHALLVFDQYLQTYAALLPDRGGEGTIVSVWNAPVRGLKLLRSRLGGVPMEERPHSNAPVDAPPLPIFQPVK